MDPMVAVDEGLQGQRGMSAAGHNTLSCSLEVLGETWKYLV